MFQMHCVPAMPGIERDRTLLHMKRIPCTSAHGFYRLPLLSVC